MFLQILLSSLETNMSTASVFTLKGKMPVGQDTTVFVSICQIPVVCTAGHECLGFECRICFTNTKKMVSIKTDRDFWVVHSQNITDLIPCSFINSFMHLSLIPSHGYCWIRILSIGLEKKTQFPHS